MFFIAKALILVSFFPKENFIPFSPDQDSTILKIELQESDITIWNSPLKKLILSANKEVIDFEDLPYVVKRFQKGNEGKKTQVTVEISDRVPYFIADYLEVHLSKAGVHSFKYLYNKQEIYRFIGGKFPPAKCEELVCLGKCITRPLLPLAHKKILAKHHLKPYYNPPFDFCNDPTKDQFRMVVTNDNGFKRTTEKIDSLSLKKEITLYLESKDSSKWKILSLITSTNTTFKAYAKSHLLLQNIIEEIKDEISNKAYGSNYRELSKKQKRELQEKIPVYSIGIRL